MTIRSEQEHKYTSTGIKFWRHPEQMNQYKSGGNNTIISTHISPEGACNLNCPYCSVTHRVTHNRIAFDVIQDYVIKLKTRGLKAVILTGGGEPTAYQNINELVQWLNNDQGLSVALITNGTLTDRIKPQTWQCFSWIRVSINIFPGWEEKIYLPLDLVPETTVIGCSSVYTADHESQEDTLDRVDMLQRIARVADNCRAQYIRLLPNCLLEQDDLIAQHSNLSKTLEQVNDPRFFHQYKVHGEPHSSICHQSYFRPYLSEVNGGTVYPCDSVVLNNGIAYFAEQYQLCKAADVLEYLDHRIKAGFDPHQHCKGCVFTDNINMLDDYINGKIEEFDRFQAPLLHEEFV